MSEPSERERGPRADAARSRARSLEAAARLFADNPRATMAQVATAAGIGRSTLHRHFPTRADLDRALEREAAAAPQATDVLPAGRLGRAEPPPGQGPPGLA